MADQRLARALLDLQELTRRLRRDCPWDREQTATTIVPHTVEEAYEVADAALAGNAEKLADELGDLLFQVYFLSLLLEEQGESDLADVAQLAHAKLVRRHPHVFGDAEARTAGRVKQRWEQLKTEQEGREDLSRRARLAARAPTGSEGATSGGDGRLRLAGSRGPAAKVREELDELAEAVTASGRPRRRPIRIPRCWERSAISSSVVNVARRLNVDPELALRATTSRFVMRVERAVELAAEAGVDWSELDLDAQDAWYDRAKAALDESGSRRG